LGWGGGDRTRQWSAAEVKDEETDPHLFNYIEHKMRLGRANTQWKCPKARVKCPLATLHSISKEFTFSVAVNETLILHHGNIAKRSHHHHC
jgi:hypothetical protein